MAQCCFSTLAARDTACSVRHLPATPGSLMTALRRSNPRREIRRSGVDLCHVPNGYSGDATAAIIAQIERFAPGFRDRIVGHITRTTTHMASYNTNYVGGDIMTG